MVNMGPKQREQISHAKVVDLGGEKDGVWSHGDPEISINLMPLQKTSGGGGGARGRLPHDGGVRHARPVRAGH